MTGDDQGAGGPPAGGGSSTVDDSRAAGLTAMRAPAPTAARSASTVASTVASPAGPRTGGAAQGGGGGRGGGGGGGTASADGGEAWVPVQRYLADEWRRTELNIVDSLRHAALERIYAAYQSTQRASLSDAERTAVLVRLDAMNRGSAEVWLALRDDINRRADSAARAP